MEIHSWSHVCDAQLDPKFVDQIESDYIIGEFCATENCQNKLGIELGFEIYCNNCRLDQYKQEYDDEYLGVDRK